MGEAGKVGRGEGKGACGMEKSWVSALSKQVSWKKNQVELLVLEASRSNRVLLFLDSLDTSKQ